MPEHESLRPRRGRQPSCDGRQFPSKCVDRTGTGTPYADGQSVDTSALGPQCFRVRNFGPGADGESAEVDFTIVDQTPPTITINNPKEGDKFTEGDQSKADYQCTDANGVSTCAGNVANGANIDTSLATGRSAWARTAATGPVSKTFTVTATDTSGNKATKTVNYTVSPKAAAPAPAPVQAQGGVQGVFLQACTSKRQFRIRLRIPRNLTARRASVLVNGKTVKVLRQPAERPRPPDRAPAGTFKVKIKVLTTKGTTLSGERTYHTCTPKRPGKVPHL